MRHASPFDTDPPLLFRIDGEQKPEEGCGSATDAGGSGPHDGPSCLILLSSAAFASVTFTGGLFAFTGWA